MQKNMIFSGMNSALTEEKNLKMKRNVDSYENNFNFGKYNTLLEIKKELNEEKKNNDNDYINKQNNLFKYNSYIGFQNNELFHKNLNIELEKNKNKIIKENNINNNNNSIKNYEDILNKINNFSNNTFIDEIENLKNKISQYETTLENTKNQYQKQINFYVEQLSNYNTLISIISNFFKRISNKFIQNINLNIPNNQIENNNLLNPKEIEEKFNKIEQYIAELNSELNENKNKNKNNLVLLNKENKLTFDKNIDLDKNEIDKFILYNSNTNNINDSFHNTNMNNDLFSEEKEFIFKNEILAKKVRSKSGTKPKINLNKKLSENKKNLFKNKNVKNEKKLAKRNNSYRDKEIKNNNIDIIQNNKKTKKKPKTFNNIPVKLNKKSKSKTDIKKVKSINLK